ncbi:hypothetical protein V8B97DRAFT_1102216 [Scleroderma yunnanense]
MSCQPTKLIMYGHMDTFRDSLFLPSISGKRRGIVTKTLSTIHIFLPHYPVFCRPHTIGIAVTGCSYLLQTLAFAHLDSMNSYTEMLPILSWSSMVLLFITCPLYLVRVKS